MFVDEELERPFGSGWRIKRTMEQSGIVNIRELKTQRGSK